MLINLAWKQYDVNVLTVVNNIVKYSPNIVFIIRYVKCYKIKILLRLFKAYVLLYFAYINYKLILDRDWLFSVWHLYFFGQYFLTLLSKFIEIDHFRGMFLNTLFSFHNFVWYVFQNVKAFLSKFLYLI